MFAKKRISLRARNFDSEKIKVNDKVGNPIQIGVILVWQVKDTSKAAFDVDNYEGFVRIQSDSAVRKLAGQYPYDNFDADSEITLRSGQDEVNQALEENLKNSGYLLRGWLSVKKIGEVKAKVLDKRK